MCLVALIFRTQTSNSELTAQHPGEVVDPGWDDIPTQLPAMGMPDMGGMDMGGFDW